MRSASISDWMCHIDMMWLQLVGMVDKGQDGIIKRIYDHSLALGLFHMYHHKSEVSSIYDLVDLFLYCKSKCSTLVSEGILLNECVNRNT